MHIMNWRTDDTAPKTGPVTVVERFQKGKIASKRAQTELARSLPSGSDFFKIPEEKQETDGTGLCEDGIAESRDFLRLSTVLPAKGHSVWTEKLPEEWPWKCFVHPFPFFQKMPMQPRRQLASLLPSVIIMKCTGYTKRPHAMRRTV